MNNFKAREQLRDMLEFQIRQKEKQRLQDDQLPYRKRLYDKSAIL